jgi:Ca2+-binding EF-hand superfamily protein
MERTSAATDSLTDQDDVMADAFQFFCDIGQEGGGNPSFTEHELAQIMDLMGEQMTQDEMSEMLNFLDPQGNGEVTFEDFMDVMKKL